MHQRVQSWRPAGRFNQHRLQRESTAAWRHAGRLNQRRLQRECAAEWHPGSSWLQAGRLNQHRLQHECTAAWENIISIADATEVIFKDSPDGNGNSMGLVTNSRCLTQAAKRRDNGTARMWPRPFWRPFALKFG